MCIYIMYLNNNYFCAIQGEDHFNGDMSRGIDRGRKGLPQTRILR